MNDLSKLVEEIKKFCIGFPCVFKIDNHTKASYRIFILTEFGMITILYFEDKNCFVCKSKRFIEKSKIDTLFEVKESYKNV